MQFHTLYELCGVGVHNIIWSMDEWVQIDNLFAPHTCLHNLLYVLSSIQFSDTYSMKTTLNFSDWY